MVSRGRHPKSEIAAALDAASKAGLEVERDKKGHRWGRVRCTYCGMPPFTVWGTPRNPGSHAKDINRFVATHLHGKELRL
ncbi:MAG: hypothetical protein ACRDSL_26345 [Pseudonocardiaceae bacterium]